MDKSYGAMVAAIGIHANQRRKYTNSPYAEHLAEVAGIVSTVVLDRPERDTAIATAWLHDSIEDQSITAEWIAERFGPEVSAGVLLLSDLEEGNRATRKALARERLSAAPRWVQNVKVADLISNTKSIVEHDPKFAQLYCEEARLLISALTKADRRLVGLCLSGLPHVGADGQC